MSAVALQQDKERHAQLVLQVSPGGCGLTLGVCERLLRHLILKDYLREDVSAQGNYNSIVSVLVLNHVSGGRGCRFWVRRCEAVPSWWLKCTGRKLG
jgi:hypothetical protein